MQESFTDTIAFNQLFSGEIVGVIMEFKKKKNSKGGRAAYPTRGEKAAYRGRGQHKGKPSTFRKKKRGGEGEGKGGVIATEGGRSKCDPESAALRLPHANSTPSAALTNDF